MKMILAILRDVDSDPVTRELTAGYFRVTRIASTGGFFRRGNVTLLIGVEEEKVEDALKIVQANCRTRADARPVESGMPSYGATVFVLDAERFVRM